MFNKFTILNQNVKVSSLNIRSSWRVAWGKVDLIREEVTWRDRKLAIITPERKAIAISPSQRFVIIGDLWLGTKVELLQKLGLEPSKFLGNDSEIIARAWEKWGFECLSLLKGMFALAVGDRHEQIWYCVRDCSGAKNLCCLC